MSALPNPARFVRSCAATLAVGAALVLGLGPSAGATTGGTQLWVARYNDPKNANDEAFSVASSPDGSKVFVTGNSNGNYATVAYDASTGAKLWVARYNGPGRGLDVGSMVGVSPDGSKVFVTGYSYGGTTTGPDYATIAYDASTGTQLWVARYNGPGNGTDYALSLTSSPDGYKVFVTGASTGTTTGLDYATIAYDASTGTQLWVARYNGPGDGDDSAVRLAASPDGSKVLVTGWGEGTATGLDYATIAYDASTGTQVWVARYNGPASGEDIPQAMAVSPDGSKVFVTGHSDGGTTTGGDYATVAYDASTGVPLWVRRYNDAQNGNDDANSLAASPDGSRVFVTGSSNGATTHDYVTPDYVTVAYDASTGTQLWVRRYTGPGNSDDDASAVASSPDGSKVFVTGLSTGTTTNHDYATVAYDASTGARLWLKRYNGPGNGGDEARSIAPTPDGSKVFVTGESLGTTTGGDYTTIAYAA